MFLSSVRSRKQSSRPFLEQLEDRLAPTGYLLTFTAALKVNQNGVDLGGIFIMRPDGSGLRQITSFQTLDFNYELHGLNLPDDQPSFSPDGTKMVFTSNRDAGPRIGLSAAGFEIYTMNVNGTNVHRLTFSPGLDTEPVFSPDGSKIAFTSARLGNLDIWVMNADGSNPRQLTTSPLDDIEPAWSPDGTKIAFSRVQGVDDKDVFVMNADGSGQRQLTFTPGQDHDPSWSPDGTQLVITSERAGSPPFGDVFKIRASDGAPIAHLTSDLALGGGDPAWSPDGKQIAFFKDDLPIKIPPDLVVPPIRLWIMNADGSNKQVFPSQGLLNVHPSWGLAVDSDGDGRLDYLENSNLTFTADNFGGSPSAAGDQFGAAIGTGDLSGDGKPDLEVGAPGATVKGLAGAGRVDLALGTPEGPDFDGLTAGYASTTLDARLVGGTPQTGGHFGQSIAAGDFKGLGHGLNATVIGAPGQNQVFIGNSPSTPWQIFSGGGGFGSALAVGDFNGDGRADLAVGAPQGLVLIRVGLSFVFVPVGSVSVFYGSPDGLSSTPQVLTGAILSGDPPPAPGDQFGYALAAGDVTGDGAADLIIGVPGRTVNGVPSAGQVVVIPGKIGVGLDGSQAVTRDARSLPAPYTGLQAGARFGEALAAGLFHGGTFGSTDLAVGIPSQDISGVADAGLVAVYTGRSSVLTSGGLATTAIAFNALDVAGANAGLPLTSARFGQTLAAEDFTGDAVQDLAIAAPNQDVRTALPGGVVSTASRAGVFTIVPGSGGGSLSVGQLALGGGLVPAAAQQFNLSQLGDFAITGDQAGFSPGLPSANTLAAADLDGDGQDDLFVGVPSRNNASVGPMSGLVGIRYGIKVGTFQLTPAHATVQAGDLVIYTLTWTHPQRWRDLETLQFRLNSAAGIPVWVRWSQASNTFSLLDPVRGQFGREGAPGSPFNLETSAVALELPQTSVQGSGPTGRSVTLRIALRFKPPLAGRDYQIELLATDVHGNSQGFDPAGTVQIVPPGGHGRSVLQGDDGSDLPWSDATDAVILATRTAWDTNHTAWALLLAEPTSRRDSDIYSETSSKDQIANLLRRALDIAVRKPKKPNA